jgi:hypothetical protein
VLALALAVAALAAPVSGAAGGHRHRDQHRHADRLSAKRVRIGNLRAVDRPRPPRESAIQSRASSPLAPTCALDATLPGAPVEMTLPGCVLLAADAATVANPVSFWGAVECGTATSRPDPARQQQLGSGADPHLTATGAAADPFYRQLTLLDGDDFYGERCELGRNDHESGPTAFYHEGERRITYFSERLPANFPIATDQWQTVMQMKQAQPSHDDGSGVALELQVIDNKWVVANEWKTIQTFPARAGTWTRFAWDVYYSQDPGKGWLQVSADLDGDGDFEGSGERSPVIHAATLQTEVAGSFNGADGLAAGAPIPSHLRMGLYHDPSILCPSPGGCSIDVDNVQVLAP